MKLLAVLALAVALPASAKVIASIESPEGHVNLHDDIGPCVQAAKRAEYIAKDGTVIPGCYVIEGPRVNIVFFDGDAGTVPISALRSPM